jgi:phosphate starvation-inducible protein PhoH
MAKQGKRTPKYIEEEVDGFVDFKTDIKLTAKQKALEELIYKNKIIVATGPPGTSKTFCAAYAALKLFSKGNDFNRIIITKPTEIIGTTALGFTPGSLEEKLAVYMENFNDVFEDIIEYNTLKQMVAADEIQYKAPQFVRGRTIKNSVVIVDEFQSFDIHMLRALVTRMGKLHCKMIFCGDIKQNDIAKRYVAVNVFKEVLKDLPGVVLFDFNKEDILFRDPLVKLIEERFDVMEAENKLTPTKKNT